MKNVSFGMTIHPLTMLAIANMLGIILGFVSIKLINRVSDKELQRSKEVIHPTNQELRRYLFEGRKQSKRLILMICFLFFLVFSNVIFLYFMPQNILMFLLNIAILAGSILTVWAIRPIKRSQAHKLLEGKLESTLIE
ncbi:hypothetical protein [Gracilibacillus phocaeensis]|uniref:hypothetical protein n=1 Tax=Gracilibacillus phocaeensis TaxID=2042304 RepID=UPI0013EF124B|nr:hypothetical protein [Gracilibacillus phocaeensis]